MVGILSSFSFEARFPYLGMMGRFGPYCEDCPAHCKMFSSVPGLRPPDASHTSPNIATDPLGVGDGQNHPWLRTTDFKEYKSLILEMAKFSLDVLAGAL